MMGCTTVFGIGYKDIWCIGVLTSKYLQILDNTPGHNTESLQFNHPSIKEMFLYHLTTRHCNLSEQRIIKICLIILKVYKSTKSKSLTGVSDTLEHFWKVDNEDYINVIKMTWDELNISYILESNPHRFYSFRGLKNQMRIRFTFVSWILEK